MTYAIRSLNSQLTNVVGMKGTLISCTCPCITEAVVVLFVVVPASLLLLLLLLVFMLREFVKPNQMTKSCDPSAARRELADASQMDVHMDHVHKHIITNLSCSLHLFYFVLLFGSCSQS